MNATLDERLATLQKLIEIMPQQLCVILTAKGGPLKWLNWLVKECVTLFLMATFLGQAMCLCNSRARVSFAGYNEENGCCKLWYKYADLFYIVDLFFVNDFSRLALIHPEVFLCMDLQVVEKLCWPKLWLITPQVGHGYHTESHHVLSCTILWNSLHFHFFYFVAKWIAGMYLL